MLSRLSSPPIYWGGNCGGADEECLNSVYCAGGVALFLLPGAIFRMKFMGALGFASERAKRPAVADGGKGVGGCA